MAISYIEGGFKKIDEKSFEIKFKNLIGSGEATINPKILLDGKDITESTQIRIGSGEFREVKKEMGVYSFYGDEISIRIRLENPLANGQHKVKLVIEIKEPLWTTFSKEVIVKM